MEMLTYLLNMGERVPAWLEEYSRGDSRFDLCDFLNSRILYYPGSGTDLDPLALFARSRAAHCFIYVDYGLKKSEIERDILLGGNEFLRGYNRVDRINISDLGLLSGGFVRNVSPDGMANAGFAQGFVRPYCFLEILERTGTLGEEDGPPRIAIMFLAAESIAAYDALFCQEPCRPPFAMVVQDHGFGGNCDSFGHGGLLERLALESKAIPDFLLVGEDTSPWVGFKELINLEPTRGGMHQQNRMLFERSS